MKLELTENYFKFNGTRGAAGRLAKTAVSPLQSRRTHN